MAVQTQIQVRRGTASSWTSTNPTLAAGELGFETDTGKFKIGTGAATWTSLTYAGGGQNTLTTYQYTATSGQTTFSGVDSNGNTLSYTVGNIQVYLNGVLLVNTAEYTATNGTSIVLGTGAVTGDSLTVTSLGAFTVSSDIPKSTLTAKGSIVTATAGSTPANLSVGANGTVLTADSAETSGLKWGTVSAGADWSLLNAGGTALTGASTITVSGISGKDKIYVLIENATTGTGSSNISVRVNSDSGGNYVQNGFRNEMASSYNVNAFAAQFSSAATEISVATTGGSGVVAMANVNFTGCNASGVKQWSCSGSGNQTAGLRQMHRSGVYTGSSTISSVSVLADYNFTGGNIYVYTSA